VSARTIDLNCDLGEDPARRAHDAELLRLVTSANIACGGHAGDEQSMRDTVRVATERGVAVGAHPGYPDRARFGRVALDVPIPEIQSFVSAQIEQFTLIAVQYGTVVTHIKPHGALYHAAMASEPIARAVARAAAATAPGALLVGLAGAPAIDVWMDMGMGVLREAFADRRYEPDGSLRPRSAAGSLISSPRDAAEQAACIALGNAFPAGEYSRLTVNADTICVHSDTPDAVAIAGAVRSALVGAGVRVSRPARARA